MDYLLLAQVIAAFGTLSMAVLIFYIEILRKRWNGPEIKIEFQQKEPYCKEVPWIFEEDMDVASFPSKAIPLSGSTSLRHGMFFSPSEGVTYRTPAYWIRVMVKNEGRTVAKKCEGQLVEVRDAENKLVKNFVPLILRWSSRPDIGPIDVNRGASWFLDIIFINEKIKNLSVTAKFSEYAHICDIYRGQPTGTMKDLKAGEYHLKITIYGDNFEPQTEEFQMKWSGKWNETGKESIFFKTIKIK